MKKKKLPLIGVAMGWRATSQKSPLGLCPFNPLYAVQSKLSIPPWNKEAGHGEDPSV